VNAYSKGVSLKLFRPTPSGGKTGRWFKCNLFCV
jgi:hypothetical protein